MTTEQAQPTDPTDAMRRRDDAHLVLVLSRALAAMDAENTRLRAERADALGLVDDMFRPWTTGRRTYPGYAAIDVRAEVERVDQWRQRRVVLEESSWKMSGRASSPPWPLTAKEAGSEEREVQLPCGATTQLGSYKVSCVREVGHSQLHKSDRGSEWGPGYAFLSRDEECPGLPECVGSCCRSWEELHPGEIM